MMFTLKSKNFVSLILLLPALLLGVGASAVSAQIPEKFENLQIFPKDISRGDLVGEMRAMAGALGLRCHHCHAGEAGGSLEGYDFASDEKERKKTARVMMRMVEQINSELLPKIGKERSELVRVRCITCHHGQARPRTLQDVLSEEVEGGGVDAAIAKYRELREQYYGGHTFDFTEWRLLNVAEALGEKGQHDEASRFLELNLEFYPESGMTYVGLGQYHQKKGDKKQAVTNFKKALELMPNMAARIQPLIDQLNQ